MDRAEEHPAGINTHHRPGRQIGTIPEPKLTVFLGAYEWGEAFRSGCCRQRGIWQGLLLSAGTRNGTSPHHPQMPCIGRCRLHAGMRWHARRWSARYNTLLKTVYLILSGDALPGAMSGDTVCRAHRNMPPAQLRRCGGRHRLVQPRMPPSAPQDERQGRLLPYRSCVTQAEVSLRRRRGGTRENPPRRVLHRCGGFSLCYDSCI